MTFFLDLDGTLIDMSARWWRLHCDLTKKYNLPHFKRSTYIRLKRSGLKESEIMRLISADQEKIFLYCRNRIEIIEQKKYLKYDKLFPFVKNILNKSSLANDLLIVTNRRSRLNLLWQLKRMGVARLFVGILSAGDRTKEQSLRESAYFKKFSKSIFISDSYEDYLLAQKHGVRFFVATYGCRDLHYFQRKNITKNFISKPVNLSKILCKN